MENTSTITLFDYKNIKVRTVIIDGDIWFVAKDICDILDIANSRDAISSLSDKMKLTLQGKESLVGLTDDPNVTQISLISEPGMYKLVFKSRKPEAEKFSDWVVGEVLPTIRKTGSYGITKRLSPMMMRFSLNAKQNSTLGYRSMIISILYLLSGFKKNDSPKDVPNILSRGRMSIFYHIYRILFLVGLHIKIPMNRSKETI